MPPNTESLIPQLLANYVHSRRSDLSLPSSTVLPFVVGPTTAEATYPRVIFLTSAVEMMHPKRFKLTILVELQTHEKSDPVQENAWTAGIRYSLADVQAFSTYLRGLTLAQRTGWNMIGYRLGESDLSLITDSATRTRSTDVIVTVRSDELGPD